MLRNRYLPFIALNLLGVFAFFWPFLIPTLHNEQFRKLFNAADSKWWSLFILPIAFLIFLKDSDSAIAKSNLVSKRVALLGVLIALACVMRFLGAGAVGIEPIWFLLIIVGFIFGSKFGFLFGNLALLVSGIFIGGFGPWLPFQMLAAGWITAGAGLIKKITKLNYVRLVLIPYSIFASFLFGLLMDLQLWPWLLGSQSQIAFSLDQSAYENLKHFLFFHFTTSLAWDVPRAILTAALIFFSGNLLISSLQRTAIRLQLN